MAKMGTFAQLAGSGEVRRRVGFTLLAILVFRAGCQVTAPGVDGHAMARLVGERAGPLISFLDLFSGGALERFSIFALGLQPFINASIILQLLTHAVPWLERLRTEEGREGQARLAFWTRVGAVVLSVVQAFSICLVLEAQDHGRAAGLLSAHGWGFRLPAIAALVAGSGFLMWLSELVTRRGVGNGASVLIAAGIVARLPTGLAAAAQSFELDRLAPLAFVKLALLLLALSGLTALVVTIHDAVRKIPLQHARQLERGTHRPATGAIPLKLNSGGVMPVIFASSVMALGAMLLPALRDHARACLALEFGLIIAFAYFYTALSVDPRELADALRRQGAFTPGIRAGAPTARHIDHVLSRITLAGGVFLGALALAPHALLALFGGGLAFAGLGGTSLLIVVGVTLDAAESLAAHALERQYGRVL